jgi:hypothetical protein
VKNIDWQLIGDDGRLLLLTAEEIILNGLFFMADFRDTHAAYYNVVHRWLGVDNTGVWFGEGPATLINGIWYVRKDLELIIKYPNHQPDVNHISLEIILP